MTACSLRHICNEGKDFFIELQEIPELEGVENDDENDITDRSLVAYRACLRKTIAQKHC